MSHDFHPPSCASLANPCLCIGLPHLWDSPHANFLPPENSNGSFQWKKKGFYFFVHEDEVQNGQVYKTCDVFKQLAEIRLFIMFSGTLNWRCGSLTQQVGNEAGINKDGFQCWGGRGGEEAISGNTMDCRGGERPPSVLTICCATGGIGRAEAAKQLLPY